MDWQTLATTLFPLGHQITDEVGIMSPFVQLLETLEPKDFLPSDHES